MLDWLFKGKNNSSQSYQFVPTIQIDPNSTLFIECLPNDPHTASNIVINTYVSKTNRTLLQTRIQWTRFKFITESQHSVQKLTYVTGNVYRCEPSDLGSYINAKIISVDVGCTGQGEVTIGPIRIDEILKNVVDGALYDRTLRSQIKIAEKNNLRNVDMILTDQEIRFVEETTGEKLITKYNLSQPRIELNPKDPTKIFLRFEKDQENTVRNWLNIFFPQNNPSDQMSEKSKNSNSSKSRLFKSLYCVNKIQVIFLTRNCRDLFLFSQKAFICKELMKNSIVLEKVEQLLEMKSIDDYHRFLHYMSLRYEIFRLAELAKQYQKDRDQKVKDISELEDSIGEMTLTYMKIIQEKGKAANVDFNQSYSQISIRREQILGNKNLRELKAQNEKFKQTIRQLNEELEYQKFFKKENNDSMMFNQTNNPFLKKPGESAFQNHHAFQDQKSKQNFVELNKSYMKVLEENQRLKMKQMALSNQNVSRDMVELLESLHEDDEQDPNKVITSLKVDKKKLEKKVQDLQLKIVELQQQLSKRSIPSLKLNQSIAHQKLQSSNIHNTSNLSETSFISMNQSMMSEVAIRKLEEKLIQIRDLNTRMMEENVRLRKQRDEERNKNFSQSNIHIESEAVNRLKEQNEKLVNEKMASKKKIESLSSLVEENKKLRFQISQHQIQQKRSDENIEGKQEVNKLKKANIKLLQEIKSLKIELEKKQSPIYNSRVIELQTEVNFLKNQENHQGQEASQKLIDENAKLKKQIQKLKSQIFDKDKKLESQAALIDRLMNSSDSNSLNGKDKSLTQIRNEQSVDKLKKKIKNLQEQIIMIRRSADAVNRSHDFSMEMNQYNEEKLENLVRQKQMLLMENQRISKMCEKYAKDAREKNKWEKKALELQKKLNIQTKID